MPDTAVPATTPRQLEVVFAAERGPSQWGARHAQGLVPGRWPYGLQDLGAGRLEVRPREVPPPGRATRLLSRLPRVGRARGAALCWDENIAVRPGVLRRYDRLYSGVIWATDREPDPAVMKVLRGLRAAWVLSSAQVEPLRRLLGRETVGHLLFGVDAEFFSPGSAPESPLIFSVGGDRDRDPTTTLEAFRLVLDARPEVTAVMQTPRELAADPRIRMVKHLPHAELREMYRRATAVAVATRPNLHVSGMTVSLEAMACGRPVVATRTPGFDDYLRDGQTGAFVPLGDARAMADQLIAWVDSPLEADLTGRQGRRFVTGERTSDLMCARLREIVLDQEDEEAS